MGRIRRPASRERAARCRAWADSLPENRWHGVIAGKLYTYASDARVRRWPNGIEITGKRNTSMTDTAVSAAPVLIRYAKRIDDPVSATIAADATRPPTRGSGCARTRQPHAIRRGWSASSASAARSRLLSFPT